MPSRLENLGNAFLLRVRRQRGGQLHQLGETEDRIERATKLMAHTGEEIRFREVGFLRGGLGARQLDVRFLERLLVAFALRDVPRDSQYALQRPIPVVEGGGVVGYLRFLAVPGARGERSEEHTSELQSLRHLVCRLLLEKKKNHMFSFSIKHNIYFDWFARSHQTSP